MQTLVIEGEEEEGQGRKCTGPQSRLATGGRMGPDDPGTLMWDMGILVEGVGGRMLDDEEAADGAEVFEVLFLEREGTF